MLDDGLPNDWSCCAAACPYALCSRRFAAKAADQSEPERVVDETFVHCLAFLVSAAAAAEQPAVAAAAESWALEVVRSIQVESHCGTYAADEFRRCDCAESLDRAEDAAAAEDECAMECVQQQQVAVAIQCCVVAAA